MRTHTRGIYQANENRPENLASRTSRLFLGVKLECAQCHDDRSGGNWKRRQFWEYAAFFTQSLRTKNKAISIRGHAVAPAGCGARPHTDQRFGHLGGGPLPGRRQTRLATSRHAASSPCPNGSPGGDNPWFARAAVNPPVALLPGGRPHRSGGRPHRQPTTARPSHPGCSDEARRSKFVAHDLDLKFLIRAIALSHAYPAVQPPDAPRPGRPAPGCAPRREPRPRLRSNSTTAWCPCSNRLSVRSGQSRLVSRLPHWSCKGLIPGPVRGDPSGQPVDIRASIQQALMMMNGRFMEEATSSARSATVTAVIDSNRPVAQRIEELYLVVLSRRPRPEETRRLLDYVTTRPQRGPARHPLVAAEQHGIRPESLTPASLSDQKEPALSPRSSFHLSRRDWLRLSAAGIASYSMSGWLGTLSADAATDPKRRRSCILLWMNGGPSQMDTFDLKPGHANGGPFRELATVGARDQDRSEHLPRVARHMDRLVLVRLHDEQGRRSRPGQLLRPTPAT